MCSARNISEPVKREVRRRCGFGCVVCGHPIVEYHHMTAWAKVHRHVADDITLLCPNEHKDATGPNAELSEGAVRAANGDPYVKRMGWSKPKQLRYGPEIPPVYFGSNVVEPWGHDVVNALSLNGEPVLTLRIEDGGLLVSAEFWDKTGTTVLRIVDNEWMLAEGAWDARMQGNLLTLHQGSRDILVGLRFNPEGFVVERARLYADREIYIVNEMGVMDEDHGNAVMGTYVGPGGIQLGTPTFERTYRRMIASAAVSWAERRFTGLRSGAAPLRRKIAGCSEY